MLGTSLDKRPIEPIACAGVEIKHEDIDETRSLRQANKTFKEKKEGFASKKKHLKKKKEGFVNGAPI
jgi:hypothetical protein